MLRLLSVLLIFTLRLALAADEEFDLYAQASKAFADKFYERAEGQFADFVQKFPASTNAASAILLQAEARFFLRRYDAASDLLQANIAKAGALGADFTFWTGEAQSELGNYQPATQLYRKVLTDFPQSPLRLKAGYLEAYCAYQAKEYARVVDLLQDSTGVFQKLVKESPADPA